MSREKNLKFPMYLRVEKYVTQLPVLYKVENYVTKTKVELSCQCTGSSHVQKTFQKVAAIFVKN